LEFKDEKNKEKRLYFYLKKNGKKNRQRGIIRYYKTGWDIFEENKDAFIKANFIEVFLYHIRQNWSSFNTFQKIQIILALFAVTVSILIAFLLK